MYPIIHIALPSYAVLAAIGGFAAMLLIYFRIDKYNLPFGDFVKMFLVCIGFGFIGSRIVYIVSRIPWLFSNFSLQHLLSTIIGGGLVFYGGLLGVLFGIFVYCRKKGIERGNIYNLIAPAIPLFHVFGRIGCFLSGCCYGLELKTPINLFGVVTFSRIPTQLIEALFEAILFVLIYTLQRKNKGKDYLKIYMISYAIFRFFIEFFRGDHVRGYFFGFSTSQLISIGILVFYIISAIRHKRHNTAAET